MRIKRLAAKLYELRWAILAGASCAVIGANVEIYPADRTPAPSATPRTAWPGYLQPQPGDVVVREVLVMLEGNETQAAHGGTLAVRLDESPPLQ